LLDGITTFMKIDGKTVPKDMRVDVLGKLSFALR
jgi:hypothetical protein